MKKLSGKKIAAVLLAVTAIPALAGAVRHGFRKKKIQYQSGKTTERGM